MIVLFQLSNGQVSLILRQSRVIYMPPDVSIFRWMAGLAGFLEGLSKMLLVQKEKPLKLMFA